MKRILALIILSFMIVSLIIPIMNKKEKPNNNIKKGIVEEIKKEVITEEVKEIEQKDPIEEAVEKMNKEMNSISNLKNINKKAWYINYKKILDKYNYILDAPESIYDYFTEEELDIFFHVVQAEIGDEYSFEQKVNVANVILNRIYHYEFADNMFDVLTPSQFETINNGRYKKVDVSETTVLACEYAFRFNDTTQGSLFFDSNNALKYEFVFNDGAHNFYRLKGEKLESYVLYEEY